MAQPGSFFGHNRRSGFGRERSSSSTTSSASASRSDTPPSRAGNIVISSSEVGKIFDAINSLSNKMSTQEEMLKKLTTAMEDLEDEVQELKVKEKSLLEKIEVFHDREVVEDGSKIPPEVSADVHLLHNNLSLDRQYNPEESALSPHNMSVRHHLEEQIANEDKGYAIKTVKRAIVRYYETKRKLYLQSLPENQQKTKQTRKDNKVRSRRKRLFSARVKVARGKEKELMQELSYDFVSDEEDGPEGNWIIRSPRWRSPRANDLMSRLQRRIDQTREEEVRPRVPRVEGPLSERPRPKVHVPWALGEEAARGYAEPNSEPEEVPTETPVASPPRRRRKRYHCLNDDSESD
ncbi:uncharacterized protein C14orf93-like [Montipora capricornis]|uniref:uncharacterized protein C14orf93-like n=1 Tax=Montipora capricornis TaxID=246305 RepID=UPI0035F0FE2C